MQQFAPALLVLLLPLVTANSSAQAPAGRIGASGIEGTLVICGGGALPEEAVEAFLDAAGGKSARLVVVPTAGERADEADSGELLQPWTERDLALVVLLHTRSREEADREEFVAPLREATAVWFEGGQQSRLAEAYAGTLFEKELHALLERGGAVGGTSAGAAIMSRLMIARGNPQAELGAGFDLLPDAVIDQHFSQRNRKPRLRAVLEQNPGRFGLGIDEGTAVVVQGRRMRVLGDSTATVCFAASEHRGVREITLRPGQVADLTTFRRAARNRASAAFPSSEPKPPVVENGSLLIVGGGGFTEEMVEKFIELAGGPDAPLVVIPTADADPLPPEDRAVEVFRRAGAEDVQVLHARTAAEIAAPGFLEPLRRAKGVWFGGGRQWRLVDAYQGTEVEKLFHDVLRRGGVIGGSSAGASIQAEYLVRGHPRGNRVMMAEGYERGFGFLPGAAIDQHFAQRKRFADLESVVQTFPQLLGIGIDETTALVVRGRTAEVLGKNEVHFYHAPPEDEDGELEHTVIGAGRKYNLVERTLID